MEYLGVEIKPTNDKALQDQGFHWYIPICRLDSGIWYQEKDCPRFTTVSEAQIYILRTTT